MNSSRQHTTLPTFEFHHQSSDYLTGSAAYAYSGSAASGPMPGILDSRTLELFRRKAYDSFKRALDIMLSLLFLSILSPVMVVVSLLILIEDGGPIVFRQQRIGRDGRTFRMFKFRSLRNSGFDENDPNASIERRMLRTGAFLRKTHLDEVLQFFNVIQGTMSIVGPRPEMQIYHDRALEMIPYYHHRLLVKPGLTGWAQTHYQHTTSLDEYRVKTDYDLFYVRNRSFLLDMKIMMKTASTICSNHGSR